jgi:transcriptional regulator with XRE-family HTH domain
MGQITDETTAARRWLNAIGWSQRELARQVGASEVQVRRMFAGTISMDQALLRYLQRLGSFHEANPPPQI